MTPTDPKRFAVLFRPAAERFHSQFDWLDSWHTFSFGSHHDPAWQGFGPLLVINDDTVAAGRGFGMHPHRDMEIITVMVQGQLNHRDSMGHAEVLRAGEVQRMSAGTGVVHSEINEGTEACRFLQIWIEPSSSGIPPAYDQKHFQIGSDWTPLIDPAASAGAMAIHRRVRLWRAQPRAGQALAVSLPEGHRGWIQMIEGSGALNGGAEAATLALWRGDGLGFEGGGTGAAAPQFTAAAASDLLLFDLG
jgi:redox-sensitive bicupin YhaK (pirin superfamily)